jgi:hypothetical protein
VGEKVGYISNFDNTMLRKSRVQDYCELQGGVWWGEKVGYISNFDNTLLRKSRVRDFCGPPNSHGDLSGPSIDVKLKERKKELKRTFKIVKAWETAFRVERNAIKS